MGILEKVEEYCKQHNLFEPEDTLVVACSGGPDSLTLLDILSKLREMYALQLVVCYVHHGIRKAADDEVGFVRQAAVKRNCRFVTEYVDVPALSAIRHTSEETTGRVERYRILRQAAADYGAAAIAVAHHRNDQAETVLQHILRGSGLTGLSGMRPRSGDIIRPLLAVTRREIEDYIAEHKLTPCDDETNHSAAYTRNRIRLKLIPELAAYNPNIVDDLNRLADIAQADEEYLTEAAQNAFARSAHREGHIYRIAKRDLLTLPLALQRRVIRQLFRSVSGEDGNVPYHYTEQIRQIAGKDTGRQFRSKKVWVYTTYEHVCFMPADTPIPGTDQEKRHDDTTVLITGPGTYYLGANSITIALSQERPQIVARGACVLDYDACPDNMVLRYRRPGDRIRLGAHMSKTLKKYFIDAKIPASLRDIIPILCNNEDIIWLCGHACSAAAAAGNETKTYMICTITGGDLHA